MKSVIKEKDFYPKWPLYPPSEGYTKGRYYMNYNNRAYYMYDGENFILQTKKK